MSETTEVTPGEDVPLLLFDGECHMCDQSVQLVLDHDPLDVFRFAPLQSELAHQLLETHGLKADLDTVVLIEGGTAYTHSDAALRVARRLRFPFWLGSLALLIPRFVRDAGYRFVAANRYRWFGKKDACRIPEPSWRERFLG